MVNLRYHIVSLTAVFLALIIGILMGTTVVSKATVDGLRSNLHRAEARSEAVHKTNSALSKQLSERARVSHAVDSALSDHVLAQAVDGVLTDVPVLIVASSAVDGDTLRRTVSVLQLAGADVDGTLVVDDRLAPDKLDEKRLAGVLGVEPSDNLLSVLATRLAKVLRDAALIPGSGASSTTTQPDQPSTSVATDQTQDTTDGPSLSTTPPVPTTTLRRATEPALISALRSAGFLEFRPVDGESKRSKVLESPHLAEGVGYRYVVLSGEDPTVPDASLLAPLITKLVRDGAVPVVAASSSSDAASDPERDAFLTPLLKIGGVSGNVSTVDDLESFSGLVALTYALHGAANGHFGNYGIGPTATAVIPAYKP